MVRAAQRELRGVEVGDPGVVLADAGYWHQRQIETVVSDGIQVLISPDSSLRRGPRPGWTGGLYDVMRWVLATPDGRALYRRRQVTIEPVFGQLKSKPPDQTLPTPRPSRLPVGMAAHRGDPQPAQAPPPPAHRRPGLGKRRRAAAPPAPKPRSQTPSAGTGQAVFPDLPRQPQAKALASGRMQCVLSCAPSCETQRPRQGIRRPLAAESVLAQVRGAAARPPSRKAARRRCAVAARSAPRPAARALL